MRLGHGTALNVGPGALGPPAIWYEDNTLVISFEHGRTVFLGTELQRGHDEKRAPTIDTASFLGDAFTQIQSRSHGGYGSTTFLGTTFTQAQSKSHAGRTTSTFLGTAFTDVNHQPHSGATFN